MSSPHPAFILALFAFGFLISGDAFAAADAVRGKALAQMCIGCHGAAPVQSGNPLFTAPKLGGQHPEYIVPALRAYKTGERSDPVMKAMVASLSEQDMLDIATYFEEIRPLPPEHATGARPEIAERVCIFCHGEGGFGAVPEHPLLGGQYADYMEHALRDYRDGKRTNPSMVPFAKTLSDADIKELAAYFAQQKALRTGE